MAKNPQKPKPKTGQKPPMTDALEATQPGQPAETKGVIPDDHTKRLGNHNNLPRRDPSGQRGQRDHRANQTERGKTER